MSKPEYQDIINEYKESVRILKQEVAELQDAGKAKDSANKNIATHKNNIGMILIKRLSYFLIKVPASKKVGIIIIHDILLKLIDFIKPKYGIVEEVK